MTPRALPLSSFTQLELWVMNLNAVPMGKERRREMIKSQAEARKARGA